MHEGIRNKVAAGSNPAAPATLAKNGLLEQVQLLQEVWTWTQETACRRHMRDRDAQQGRGTREQPESEPERHANERGGEGVGPRPPAQPVIEDVDRGADRKTDRRSPQSAQPALHQAPEEGFLDRSVEREVARLEPGVTRARWDAQRAK